MPSNQNQSSSASPSENRPSQKWQICDIYGRLAQKEMDMGTITDYQSSTSIVFHGIWMEYISIYQIFMVQWTSDHQYPFKNVDINRGLGILMDIYIYIYIHRTGRTFIEILNPIEYILASWNYDRIKWVIHWLLNNSWMIIWWTLRWTYWRAVDFPFNFGPNTTILFGYVLQCIHI